MKRVGWFLTLVAAGVAADQLSKAIVFASVPAGGWPLLENVLHLTPSRNPGVAFSLLRNQPWLVLSISILALPLLAWWIWQGWEKVGRWMLFCQGLLLIGALGNLIDRITPPGEVRDFLDFRPEIPFIGHWAIFNVADVCISVGVGLFVLAEVLGSSKRPLCDAASGAPQVPTGQAAPGERHP